MSDEIVGKPTGKSYFLTKKIATINPNQVNTFFESGCIVRFPKSWKVVKFDETWFFSRLSGQNLKGVDFVAIHPDGRIVFLEIKHYRQNAPPYQDVKEALTTKMFDTRKVIRIVNQYYHRKWYLPLFRLWGRLFKNKRSQFQFWSNAAEQMEAPKQCFYLYWLLNVGWEKAMFLQLEKELRNSKALPGSHQCHFEPGFDAILGVELLV